MRKFISIPVYCIEDNEGNPVAIDTDCMQEEFNAKIGKLLEEL